MSNARLKRRFLAAARYDDHSIDLAGNDRVAPLRCLSRRLNAVDRRRPWPRRAWWPIP